MKTILPLALAMVLALPTLAAAQTTATTDAAAPTHHDHAAKMRLDTNGDGYIDRTEAASHVRLADDFDRIDADHDGRLGRDELRAFHREHMRNRSVERLNAIDAKFTAADTDHSDTLSKAEVEASGIPGLIKRFDAIDVNHDGQLQRNEVKARSKNRMHRGDRHPTKHPPVRD